MSLPRIATAAEHLAARTKLLAREKELTDLRDELNTQRRNLPMVEVEKDYRLTGPQGPAGLIDLFEGRRQLIIYHFMFDPDSDEGCPSCTAGTDEISPGFLEHLHARDTTYAMVSRAPLAKLERWKAAQGLGRAVVLVVRHRLQLRLRRHDRRVASARVGTTSAPGRSSRRWAPTSSPAARSRSRCRAGAASCRSADASSTRTRSTPAASRSTGGSYYFLDLTALGRQEDWEEPKGRSDAVRGAVPDFAS